MFAFVMPEWEYGASVTITLWPVPRGRQERLKKFQVLKGSRLWCFLLQLIASQSQHGWQTDDHYKLLSISMSFYPISQEHTCLLNSSTLTRSNLKY